MLKLVDRYPAAASSGQRGRGLKYPPFSGPRPMRSFSMTNRILTRPVKCYAKLSHFNALVMQHGDLTGKIWIGGQPMSKGNGQETIDLRAEEDDAEGFLLFVQAVAQGVLRASAQQDILIVRVNNWFDHKWLGFSGQLGIAKGASVGQRRTGLTAPPFSTGRICWQQSYRHIQSSGTFVAIECSTSLHIEQHSDKNLHRRLAELIPNTAILWFSSRSRSNKRGALMSYIPTDGDYRTWYAGMTGSQEWRTDKLENITPKELQYLRSCGSG